MPKTKGPFSELRTALGLLFSRMARQIQRVVLAKPKQGRGTARKGGVLREDLFTTYEIWTDIFKMTIFHSETLWNSTQLFES